MNKLCYRNGSIARHQFLIVIKNLKKIYINDYFENVACYSSIGKRLEVYFIVSLLFQITTVTVGEIGR